MKTNHVDACRELYRGSFKKANLVACLAGIVALAVLIPAEMAGYLPVEMSTVRIMLFALMIYGLAFAMMLWIPGRAMKKSHAQDDAEMVAPMPLQN